MPDDPDAAPARPISLEYADARAADSAAARGLVYVLAAFGLAQGWRVGFLYGDAVFNWIGYGYGALGHGLSAWVLHGSSATIALAALLAVGSGALAAAGRGGARKMAVLASALFLVAWAMTEGVSIFSYLSPHQGMSREASGPLAFVASRLAFTGVDLAVPAALLWLLTRRRIAAALAGG